MAAQDLETPFLKRYTGEDMVHPLLTQVGTERTELLQKVPSFES